MLHLAMVRSPFAHATITSIDTSEAAAAPGVIAVFTGKDIADIQGVNITAWPLSANQKSPTHLPVPLERVSHAGEIVAIVAARSAALARDAAELVDVDYDELPAVLDLKEAATDAVLAHPDLGTNKSDVWSLDSAAAGTGGDVDEAIAKAREDGVVIEREYRQQRLIPAFMEPRSTVVDPTGEQVVMWTATQVPHVLRFCIAATTGLPESKIRVIAPDVGGGFGGKLQSTPEEFATLAVARKLGRPCKYTETRSETMVSGHHGRDQWQRLTLCATKDGTVTGLKVDLLADLGAYAALVGGGVPVLGAWMFNAIYKFPAYRFTTSNYYTNKTWVDAYRGAGRPEATYAIERLMDELAAEVGVDAIAIREKNWIKHDEFPRRLRAVRQHHHAAPRADISDITPRRRAEQAQRRASGDPVQLGIGVSTFTEMCGLAPSRILGALNYGAGGWENASIRMLSTGTVEVLTGASAHGQGHETAFSQIVADRLGVPFDSVEVLHGDTQISTKGMDKARPIAAHLLEASADDVEFSAGTFTVRGTEKGISITDVALQTWTGHNLPDGVEPSLDADATFDPDNFSFPHGTHLCAMEVDTETGATRMRSYVCVDDIGTVINPLIVEGQVHGGLDYTIPSAADLINFVTDRTTTPATYTSLGTKGVGEAGTIASTPAVVNAVVDAVRHLGVNDIVMPCTPERVWKAIQHAGSAANGGAQ